MEGYLGLGSDAGMTRAHYGLVVVGALIAVYAVRAFTEALGAALEGYLGLGSDARSRLATAPGLW
jgi:hypothetical protein